MPSSITSPKKTTTESRLSLVNVTYAHEGRKIIHDISLDMAIKRLGIVGRNGSGKSTLARLIAGLIKPTKGALHLNGVDVARKRHAALNEVGILFQNPDHQIIFPTVLEEMSFGLTQLGQTKSQARTNTRTTLQHFNKLHWENTYIYKLSEGQKHLLCLMATVAMQPRMLVLDEPFTGLDIPTKAQLSRYLELYAGNIVHITHNPDDLKGYQQAIWLDEGRIMMKGKCREVTQSYAKHMKECAKNDDITDLSD